MHRIQYQGSFWVCALKKVVPMENYDRPLMYEGLLLIEKLWQVSDISGLLSIKKLWQVSRCPADICRPGADRKIWSGQARHTVGLHRRYGLVL